MVAVRRDRVNICIFDDQEGCVVLYGDEQKSMSYEDAFRYLCGITDEAHRQGLEIGVWNEGSYADSYYGAGGGGQHE